MIDAQPLEVIHGARRAATLLQPMRRRLVAGLSEPRSAAGLARALGLPRQLVNYHLRELERQGLVECVEERRKGNCTERLVRATARAFVISPEAIGALGTTPEAARDRLSAAYLMTAAARAIRDVALMEAAARKENKRVATFTMESEVRFASAAARARFAQELSDAVARLVARHHDATAPGGRTFRLLSAIHPAPAAGAAAAPDEPGRARPRARRKKS